jgi:hypothetical protein
MCRVCLYLYTVVPSVNKSCVVYIFHLSMSCQYSPRHLLIKLSSSATHAGMHDKDSRWRQQAKRFHRKVVRHIHTNMCQCNVNKLIFLLWGLLSLTLNPEKLNDHPLSAVRYWFAATLHTWRASPPSATWWRAMPWWQGGGERER